MIFLLNKNISLQRKMGYIGLILVIGAVVLASIGVPYDLRYENLFKLSSILCVSGFSLIVIALTQRNTKKNFGSIGSYVAASTIPVICLVAFYLVGMWLISERYAETYIMNNGAIIMAVSIPLAIVAAIVLERLLRNLNTSP